MPSFVSKFLITGDGELLIAPASDGSAGQILQTDGNGQLSFTIPPSNGMSDLIDDTTPQLGGNLDLNGFNVGGVTPTEFTYLSGVTSDIQTQLDGKAATSHTHTTSDVTDFDTEVSNNASVAANTSGVSTNAGNISTNTSNIATNTSAIAGKADAVHTHTASDITDFDTEVSNNPTVASALQDVVDDTTPQLGGNLDVNGNSIVSVSNGNISLIPDGTGNVVLGTLTFDGDMAVTSNEDDYVLTYDDSTGTVSLEVLPTTSKIDVKNDTAGTLLKGRAVHVTGSHASGKPTIEYADSSSASTMNAIGILEDDIVAGGEGNVILAGIIEHIDTSSYTSGDTLYVGTSGVLTDTKPTGTDLIQNMGMVGRSHASAGSFIVIGSGRSNDVPNLPQDFLWLGNASGVATPTNRNEITELSDDTTPQLGGNLDMNGFAFSSPAAIDNDAAGPDVSLLFQNGGTSTAEIQYDDGAQDMYFAVGDTVANGATKMTIENGGHVGIGTTSPGGKLHIDGVADESIGFLMRTDYTGGVTDGDVFRIQDGSNRDGVIFGIDADAGYFRTQYVTGSAYIESSCASSRAALRMNRGTTGNDIGLDFRVGGTVKWTLGSWSSDATNNLSLTNGGLSSTKVVTIQDTTGNIGIGTSSPDQLLHVLTDTVTTVAAHFQAGVNSDYLRIGATSAGPYIGGYNSAGGVHDMAINPSGGNVGIGTASPDSLLHVYSGDSLGSHHSETILGVESNTHAAIGILTRNSQHARIYFGDQDDPRSGRIEYDHANDLLEFWTNQNQQMVINSSGYVGIGTSSPDEVLHIAKTGVSTAVTMKIQNLQGGSSLDSELLLSTSNTLTNSSVGGSILAQRVNRTGTGGTDLVFRNSNGTTLTEHMRIYDNGNVGIGTSSPGKVLDVEGSGRFSNVAGFDEAAIFADTNNNYAGIWVDGTADGSGSMTALLCDEQGWAGFSEGAGVFNDTTSTVRLCTGWTGHAAIFEGGNVGIGTNDPTEKLHVLDTNPNTTDCYIKVSGGGNANAGIRFEESDAGSQQSEISYEASGNKLHIKTGNGTQTERITILRDSGLVGIGDTSPGHLLEIADGFRTAPVSSPSGTAESGRIYMDSDDDRLKVYANGADRKLNTMTPVSIRPQQLVADATNPFTIVTRNQHVLAAFDDTADEVGFYTGILPDDYQGDGLTIDITWVAATATTGVVKWNVAFERIATGGQDIDSDGFAADQTQTEVCAATNGIIKDTPITFTDGAQMDSLAAGEVFRLRITRDADDAADTMTGDAQIVNIKIRGTNDA